MSNLNNKQYRNTRRDYYYDSPQQQEEEEVRWGLRRAGSWPSDWAPRRTCDICKKDFRTDNEEGFSNFLVDVCATCIQKLVKKEKNRVKETDVHIGRRIDEIRTQ
jgi:glutaredoxin